MSRFNNRLVFTNTAESWKQALKTRDRRKVNQHTLAQLKHPTAQQVKSLEMQGHVWKTGDRFYKLAYDAYGDSNMWWVIAWFNQTPTEADVSYGDEIQIPFPLERVLQYMDV